MSDQQVNFGAELRRRRLEASLSLGQLAARVHYSKGYLSKIENGYAPPNRGLARLCDAALDTDGSLESLVPGSTGRRGASLPFVRSELSGRSNELSWLDSQVTAAPRTQLIVLDGMGGTGKTSLAIYWAQRSAKLFPGGVIFLSCGAYPTVRDLLLDLLVHLGVPQASIPGEPELYSALCREALAKKQALVVLDDFNDAQQSMTLVELGSTSTLLITTRGRWPAELATDIRVAVLTLQGLQHQASIELISGHIGANRAEAEAEAVERLVELTDNLPLALVTAAAVLNNRPDMSVANLVVELRRVDPQPGRTSSLQVILEQAYGQLSVAAAAIFRSLGVVSELEFPPTLLVFITAQGRHDVAQAVESMASLNLLTVLPDERLQLHPMVQRFAEEKLAFVDTEATRTDLATKMGKYFVMTLVREHRQEPQITRDFWTLDDQLSHSRYADAVSEFIRHRETRPPLTIGIKAQWGAGKTSLMRMIQDRLDPGAARSPILLSLARRRDSVTNFELLRAATKRPADAPSQAEVSVSEGWRPTVWFNPWQYQSGEQVWAGLAHEIITQITRRLPVGDRERYWLRLNLARVDRDAVRRRCYRLLIERLFPWLLAWFIALIVTTVALVVGHLLPVIRHAITTLSAGLLATSTVIFLFGGAARIASFLRTAVAGSLGKLLHEPDPLSGTRKLVADSAKDSFDAVFPNPGYASRLGFLHLVQTDITRILGLVVTEDRPLIIFVDDLDRCSSSTVSQVIEAINLFLAGEYPNCIFVLGMEPASVAAHVEATYRELVTAEREGRMPSGRSTLGWRFLDKIVQLPLSLPASRTGDETRDYVKALIGSPTSPQPTEQHFQENPAMQQAASILTQPTPLVTVRREERSSSQVDVDALEREIRRRNPTTDSLREVMLASQQSLFGYSTPIMPAARTAAERVYRSLYSDADFYDVITTGLDALDSTNPREVKRFVNLFRFYTFIAQGYQIDGVVDIKPEQTAKVAAFSIRWPWILSQFREISGGHPLELLERAARADDEAWSNELRNSLRQTGENGNIPLWSASLREFLAKGSEVGTIVSYLV